MTNSTDPEQTAPIGTVCSGSTLFASIFSSSVMLGNYLQQMTSADVIFMCFFYLALKGLSCWRQQVQHNEYELVVPQSKFIDQLGLSTRNMNKGAS